MAGTEAVLILGPEMAVRSRSRRILLVANWIGWGGAETQLDYLAIGLREAGHEVVLLAIGEVHRELGRLRDAGVEIISLEALGPWAKLRALPAVVRRARWAELVHCTGWDATFWGRVAAFLARRPAVFTEHTPGRQFQVTDSGASRARAIAIHNRLLDRLTAAAIVVGVWQRALLEEEGVRADSIVHIPNAVPIDELQRRSGLGPTRAELGIPDSALVVAQVARFWPQKHQMTSLHVVARLRERLGDVRLLFVGDGPEEAPVKAEAERLNADWVSFLGFREDVPGLVRMADLSVLPSSGEGLPMSLIESIALGTPVVATDVGDVDWLLETTGAGICVPPASEEAFFDACATVLEDSDLRRRMAKQGARSVKTFDAPKMVERYERVFEAVIDSAPLPHPTADE
jgi:glycosyltransferase involved in cell wall biosynthesis